MNNTIIVGAGGIGERHVRCFQKLGVGRVGIIEPNAERRELIAERYKCQGFSTWAQARGEGPWNAGVIAAPAQVHILIALELLGCGLNLLIEKPLAVVPERLDELRLAAAMATVRVAYVYRQMEPVIELKRRLVGGGLGEPLSAQIVCGENFALARPDYAKTYYARNETGGGAIQDVLTHFINAMDWLVGPTELVHCLAGNRKLRDVAVEDTVCCSIRHQGGCLASYYLSQGQAPKETSFTVHCENGSVRADLSTMRVGDLRSGEESWMWTQFGPFQRDDFYVRQAEAFLGAIEGKADHSCTLDEAIHSLKVNVAALSSAKSGQSVTLLP